MVKPIVWRTICPNCLGTGRLYRISWVNASEEFQRTCLACHGKGYILPTIEDAEVIIRDLVKEFSSYLDGESCILSKSLGPDCCRYCRARAMLSQFLKE